MAFSASTGELDKLADVGAMADLAEQNEIDAGEVQIDQEGKTPATSLRWTWKVEIPEIDARE